MPGLYNVPPPWPVWRHCFSCSTDWVQAPRLKATIQTVSLYFFSLKWGVCVIDRVLIVNGSEQRCCLFRVKREPPAVPYTSREPQHTYSGLQRMLIIHGSPEGKERHMAICKGEKLHWSIFNALHWLTKAILSCLSLNLYLQQYASKGCWVLVLTSHSFTSEIIN